ncbi:MucB/RseB C-terminal domain-containing protein [Marinomonas pollencensis]|uniref:MucB/RseB-like sigma(E) regulatory protein n=1 Tax=Marinomonas pollencensis TaxID=491954 RepID=A0A3E0DJC0_9GAMM|nr:MucB/RseB C-terminal domain-containing protein [Marinomonas pollencensis]REG82855.1 MucB/RseB-like sigma(E) regulatory protein [Marinomonas pollencensis]
MTLSGLLRVSLMMLCASLSSLGYSASNTPDAAHLLEQMSNSFSTLDYDGIFIHSENTRMNSMRVQHQQRKGKEYESLVDLDGNKIQVIRIDDTVICVYPNEAVADKQVMSSTPFKRFIGLDSEHLKLGYNLVVSNKVARIAGREAYQLRLEPKDQYRYAHEVWLDKGNYFLLKHDMLDQNDALLDRIQFTSVTFDPDLKVADFTPNKESYSKQLVEPKARRVKSLWKFDWLPEGFSLVWPEARALNHGTSMLLLSDGMATISVFVEPVMKTKATSYLLIGATVAGEKTLKVGKQLYLVTMVGEVPKVTIEKLMSVFMPKARL